MSMIKSKPAIQRWLANISRDADLGEFRGGMASTGFGFCLAHGTTGRIVGIQLRFKSNKRGIMWKEAIMWMCRKLLNVKKLSKETMVSNCHIMWHGRWT
jgi:hypothetical protein